MRAVWSCVVSFAVLLAAGPAAPHHSFAAVFDVNRPLEITGAVTRIEWTNPHAWIHIAVEQDGGNPEEWSIELLGINTLLKQGWSPSILKQGDVITAEGFGARDGSNAVNASSVTIVETGQQLWVSASAEARDESR